MNLKTYHAYSMAEALAAVKRDLGGDAVILNTRTFKRGGFLGLGRKTIIEVTATPAAAARTAAERPAPPKLRLKDVQARRAYGAGSAAPRPGAVKPAVVADPMAEDRERTRRLAIAMEEAHRRRAAEAEESAKREGVPSNGAMGAAPVAAAPALPVARRFVLACPEKASARHEPGESQEPSRLPDQMQDELSAIREMVSHVLQRQVRATGQPLHAMPPQLFEMYLQLINQDISDELADQIVGAVRRELDDQALEEPATVRAAVLRQLAEFIPVAERAAELPRAAGEQPLTIALVGPTGVGKTTTLAKLAATFKLHQGRSVGLITADTYRIAAVDQLRTYADILSLPLHVAITPAEMKHAVTTLASNGADVILIDTAGRSQNDVNRIAELKRFITAANPHEVHLVLSSTASQKVLLQEAEAFSEVGVHNIVLTKLDEAVSFGVLVNVVRQIGKKLSFVTTGQEVPDHLEPGRADRLAELVLGGALHA